MNIKNFLWIFVAAVVVVFSNTAMAQQIVFIEDFESGWGNWYPDGGQWEIGDTLGEPLPPHSGNGVAGTNIGGGEPAGNSRLISPSITLPEVEDGEQLLLKFWHWFDFREEFNSTHRGVVEISLDGGVWQEISDIFTRSSFAWTPYIVDLSVYQGSDIRLAFHFRSSAPSTQWGWYIDDISIEKGQIAKMPNPEGFELGWGYWYPDGGGWEIGYIAGEPLPPHSGSKVAGTNLGGGEPGRYSRLISPSITLPEVANGEELLMRFWHWFDFRPEFNSTHRGVVEISLDGGVWQEISDIFTRSSLLWTPYIIDLTVYQGSNIRLAFYHKSSDPSAQWGWYIDDISIGETLVGISDLPNTPITFTLNNAYPNPFNPTTIISYSVPEKSFITLKVYDVLGNEVANLVNEEKAAGSYEITFEGTELTSGIYFYKLQAGNPSTSSGQGFVETKKMILMK